MNSSTQGRSPSAIVRLQGGSHPSPSEVIHYRNLSEQEGEESECYTEIEHLLLWERGGLVEGGLYETDMTGINGLRQSSPSQGEAEWVLIQKVRVAGYIPVDIDPECYPGLGVSAAVV